MNLNPEQFQRILEAAIMVAGRPLTLADLQKLFDETDQPTVKDIRAALEALQARYADNGVELRELASGYQFQAKVELSPWLSRLWEERPPRYSRAVLETLALIAYRQPITRAEIEEIRGVTVSSHIIKTLLEREWIRVIGYRDVPGKPALYATTKALLDHLSLKSLDELPTLSDIHDMDSQEEKLNVQLELAAAPPTVNNGDEPTSSTEAKHETVDFNTVTTESNDEPLTISEEEIPSQEIPTETEVIFPAIETLEKIIVSLEENNFSEIEQALFLEEEVTIALNEAMIQAEQPSAELDEQNEQTHPENHEADQSHHKEFSES